MSRISFKASRLGKKLRQEDMDEDPTSLSARAFRRRLLDEEAIVTPERPNRPQARVKVAVYQPKSVGWRRALLKLGLVVVAPLAGLALILWIVVTTVSQNIEVAPVQTAETIVLDNAPVPVGVRPLRRIKFTDQQTDAEIYFEKVLPTYYFNYKGSASYISPQPLEALSKYYNSKLAEPKPPPFQLFGKATFYGNTYNALYLRSLDSQRILEGLLVKLEPVDQQILKSDPEYYDRQTKLGETVIVISKAVVSLK